MAVRLQPATLSDAPILAALHAACFEPAWGAPAFAAFLASPGCVGVIASGDESPLGFVLARAAADEAEILTIAVRPDRRRHGVAEGLMRKVQETLEEDGARRLFLEVGAANAAARGLYTKLGFVPSGRRKGYYTGGADGAAEDAVLMARDLS